MNTCTIETGLLRKKPCGHAAVAMCLNCDQPLCIDHAVPQLSEAGQKTGKFLCQECVAAEREYAKNRSAAARVQEARKLAAIDKTLREQAAAPPPAKKPAAATPPAPQAAAEPAPAKEPDVLEFTPKDGKLTYTVKKDEPGYKPD